MTKIKEILKQLTPERIKKELKKIRKVKIPPEVQRWTKEYEKVGERNEFIWKWTYLGWQIFTLSCVKKEYRKLAVEIKTCNTILNVLIDDLADKRRNEQMLTEAINIFLNHKRIQDISYFNQIDQEYLSLIKSIWTYIKKNIKKYPRYQEFKDIFKYDYKQFLNTIRYSYLVNETPNFINLIEHEVYSHHNMQGMIAMTIDLMCSPKFEIEELGIFREIAWNTQQMGRINNSIATWEKEVCKNDFTSGIVSYGIENSIITIEDLKKSKKKEIIKKLKTSKSEEYFLNQWENYYNEISRLGKSIKSINIKKILESHKKFLIMHLICRGLEI